MCENSKIWTPDGYEEDSETVPRGLYRADLKSHRNYEELTEVEYIGNVQEPAKIARAVLAGKSPNLMGSRIQKKQYSNYHAPLLDFDTPIRIKRSSTTGHYHVLFDGYVEEEAHNKVMYALENAGMMQYGFVNQIKRFGQTFVRWNTTKQEEQDG